ncbi:hypothetical protein KM043_010029 [Ampulex compressa]|nr:hypothetical protein KM043_010029 [Ampulex compressa]
MAADRRRWRYDACRTATPWRPSAAPPSTNPRSSIGDTGRRRRLSRSSLVSKVRVCANRPLSLPRGRLVLLFASRYADRGLDFLPTLYTFSSSTFRAEIRDGTGEPCSTIESWDLEVHEVEL